ncbi:MAG: type II secretion system F family protein, partial [Gemmatimonadetes bacterium]|nr:type II secretion system F family protein [Gemmatimonadota bacterium]
IYLIAALFGATVVLAVYGVAGLVPARPRAVSRRLAELQHRGTAQAAAQRAAPSGREWLERMVQQLGERVEGKKEQVGTLRQFLIQAGYRHPEAPTYYWGTRVAAALALGGATLLLLPLAGAQAMVTLLVAAWAGTLGFIAPAFYVRRRIAGRQAEIRRGLPDALDLLVVCVEAGLGINQALLRVAQEIRFVSPVVGEELALVNLEIRAGSPRQDALRNLGERTGVAELRSLGAMLIQTDRFGTSVGQALRVHADSLRTQRRQRTEEAAAKTTVKLIFPLVLFIFPAMFVVLLGPALIQVVRTLSEVK